VFPVVGGEYFSLLNPYGRGLRASIMGNGIHSHNGPFVAISVQAMNADPHHVTGGGI
jgi:hypothetical protein